jgi:hypothetical protein
MTTGQQPDPQSEKLADCARTLGLVLDHMSDLVAMLDVDGKRLYNSPSYASCSAKASWRHGSFSDIHPDDRERVQRVFRETVAAASASARTYRFLLADGQRAPHRVAGRRHQGRRGQGHAGGGGGARHHRAQGIRAGAGGAQPRAAATVHELERRHRENVVLGKLGDMLQMCKSAEESRSVLAQFADELFPGTSGNLYLRNFGNEPAGDGGGLGRAKLAGDPVIGKDDCWALRRGQLHVVEGPGPRAALRHLIAPPAGACLCAPISGQGELLGMLHVQLGAEEAHLPAPVRQRRLASQQAWALTVAEHIALALANLRCAKACARRRCAIRSPASTTAATWSRRWSAKCCAPRATAARWA